MAQLSDDPHNNANWLLDYMDAALDDLAAAVASWNELSREERIDFWAEWPLKESRLAELERLASRDCLTVSQASRFREIERRLMKQRDLLDRLWRTSQPLPQNA